MRRFWAHIIIAASATTMMAASFSSIFLNAKTNVEYSKGREVTFKITDLDGESASDDTLVKEAVTMMEGRLANAQVSQYKISTSGNDIVTVSFAKDGDTEYKYVVDYLSAFGNMALTNKSSAADSEPLMLKDIRTGDAYIENVQDINPVVHIPVDVNAKTESATLLTLKEKTTADEKNAEVTKSESGEETKTYYFYLWNDFKAGRDSYIKTDSSDKENYDSNCAARLSSLKFNVENIKDDSTTLDININVDQDGDGKATETEIKSAFKTAHFYQNLLNTTGLDYKIQCIANSTSYLVPAAVEEIFAFSNIKTIAWSRTLIATLAAIAILSLLLVVFFRVGAISIAVTSLLSVFGAVGIIIAFGAEFTTAGIIGVCLVALASMSCGVLYLSKLKEDAYKGHTLKKANAEASKKSLLPIIDINVILIVTGVFAYIFGGSTMRTFAVATVMGGVVSAVSTILLLKGMMWLATNSTAMIGKYEHFGIDKEKVPNFLAEEKQTYYGPYADKDFTKKKKPTSIVLGSLAVASIVGMIVFASLTKGYIFNTGNHKVNSEAGLLTQNSAIYIEEEKYSQDAQYNLTDTIINNIIKNIKFYDESKKAAGDEFKTAVKDYKDDSMTYTIYNYTTKQDNDGEQKYEPVYHQYTIIQLTKPVTPETKVLYGTDTEPTTLEEAWKYGLYNELGRQSLNMDASVNTNTQYVVTNNPSIKGILLGSTVATLCLTLYFCLRYKLSRGLTTLIFPVVTSAVALGFFSLLRIVTPISTTIGIPFVVAFTFILSVIFMNKEREMVLEDKNRGASFEERNQIMIKANSMAYMPILIVTILGAYLAINFFGFGPSATATTYLLIILGVVISVLAVTTLFGPIAQLLYKLFSKVKIERKPKENKKKKIKKVSNEPEEAVFFGIND